MDSSATYISFIVRYVTVICCGEVSEFLLWLCFIVGYVDKRDGVEKCPNFCYGCVLL